MPGPVHRIHPTRLGPLTVVVEDDHLTALLFDAHKHPWPADRIGRQVDDGMDTVIEEIDAYLAGELREFTAALRPHGSDFQRRVWDGLREIPYGATESYLAFATRLGDPLAIRAVAAANGRNPVSILIPCHRVIGSDGSLTGYAGGLDRKRALLELEGHGFGPDGHVLPLSPWPQSSLF